MLKFFRRKRKEPEASYVDVLNEHRETLDGVKDWHRLMPLHNYDLRPCPFCGGVPNEITEVFKSAIRSFIECTGCKARTRHSSIGPHQDPYHELRDAWNYRVGDAVPEVIPHSVQQHYDPPPEQDDPKVNCRYCLMPKSYMHYCIEFNQGNCSRFQDSMKGNRQ